MYGTCSALIVSHHSLERCSSGHCRTFQHHDTHIVTNRLTQLPAIRHRPIRPKLTGIGEKTNRVPMIIARIKSTIIDHCAKLDILILLRTSGHFSTQLNSMRTHQIPSNTTVDDPPHHIMGRIDLRRSANVFDEFLTNRSLTIGTGLPSLLNNPSRRSMRERVQHSNGATKTFCDPAAVSIAGQTTLKTDLSWFHDAKMSNRAHPADQNMTNFAQTVRRKSTGLYNAWPLTIQTETQLGSSHSSGHCFGYFRRQRARRHNSRRRFNAAVLEYLTLSHLRPAITNTMTDIRCCSPHHFVAASRLKLQVVADGLVVTCTSLSLMETLRRGAPVQPELINIVVRIRKHRITFSASGEMDYHVKVDTFDLKLQQNWQRSRAANRIQHENLANMISRCLPPGEFREFRPWWSRPSIIEQDEPKWPSSHTTIAEDHSSEMNAVTAHVTRTAEPLTAFSEDNLLEPTQVMVIALQSLRNYRHPDDQQHPIRAMTDQPEAANCAIRVTYQEPVRPEQRTLQSGKQVKISTLLRPMNVFSDDAGFTRVGSRFDRFNPLRDTRHPSVLQRRHHSWKLLIRALHHQTGSARLQGLKVAVHHLNRPTRAGAAIPAKRVRWRNRRSTVTRILCGPKAIVNHSHRPTERRHAIRSIINKSALWLGRRRSKVGIRVQPIHRTSEAHKFPYAGMQNTGVDNAGDKTTGVHSAGVDNTGHPSPKATHHQAHITTLLCTPVKAILVKLVLHSISSAYISVLPHTAAQRSNRQHELAHHTNLRRLQGEPNTHHCAGASKHCVSSRSAAHAQPRRPLGGYREITTTVTGTCHRRPG